MKLYAVSDGPPSLAVRMVLAELQIPFELVPVDFIAGEHMTEAYGQVWRERIVRKSAHLTPSEINFVN